MTVSKTFHILLFGVYSYGFYYDLKYTDPPAESKDALVLKSVGGRMKYLTLINYVFLQCGYFGLCTLTDFVASDLKKNSGRSLLQVFRDWIFTTVVIPITSLVCFIFWVLYFIDRDLIYPVANDLWFPKWLNHLYHTVPIFAVIGELVLVYHTYQKGIYKFLPLTICVTAYVASLYYFAITLNFWVYPVFEVLKFPAREVVMFAMVIPSFFFVYLGESIHNFVWSVFAISTLPHLLRGCVGKRLQTYSLHVSSTHVEHDKVNNRGVYTKDYVTRRWRADV